MNKLPNAQFDVRPWGNFERFTLNEATTVKIITVSPNQSLSLQRHEHREEYWRIISGYGVATIDGHKQDVQAGDDVYIPTHGTHRIESGNETLVFMEIAFGHFDESDIERLEDKYGRS
jgi:mannose-6-phosphate isomerase-like protein (cupin superfamily)